MTQTDGDVQAEEHVPSPEESTIEETMIEGGPWAALVVLMTATALFFASFALVYFLSSTFRSDPPTVGTTSIAAVRPAPETIDIPVIPGPQGPPQGTINIPVISSRPSG